LASLALAVWAIQQFANGETANGLWITAFAVAASASLLLQTRAVRRFRTHAPDGRVHSRILAVQASALAGIALLLAVAEFTGTFIHESVWRGLLAVLGFVAFAYTAARIELDARPKTEDQE
jgi:hypothetical protein